MRENIKRRRKAQKKGECSIAPKTPTHKLSLSKAIKRRVTAMTEAAAPDGKQQIGNEERLTLIVRRAVYLHGIEGKPYRVIAQQLKDEFKLANLPAASTICRWMKLGQAEFLDDINDMRKQLRIEQFNECEELKAKWFAAANREILIVRHRMVDGKKIEIIDENAFNEQAKAATIYLKLMERQAKLIGLDLAGTEPQEGGKQSAQDIYLWISQQIQNDPKLAQDKKRTHFGNLELCLDSGIKSDM